MVKTRPKIIIFLFYAQNKLKIAQKKSKITYKKKPCPKSRNIFPEKNIYPIHAVQPYFQHSAMTHPLEEFIISMMPTPNSMEVVYQYTMSAVQPVSGVYINYIQMLGMILLPVSQRECGIQRGHASQVIKNFFSVSRIENSRD